MTTTMAPVRLSSRRDNSVLANHRLAVERLASDKASSGFNGSSTMMSWPPRPVSVPPTDVANRKPRALSSVSESFFPIRAPGNSSRYQGASTSARKSLACFLARSPEYETQMILWAGSWPSKKAGKATEVMIDFKDRGSMLMIRRRISPRRTRSSCHPIACRCHAGTKAWPGASVENDFSTKALKFQRKRACKARTSAFMLDVHICLRADCLGFGAREVREVAAKDCYVFGRYGFSISASLGALAVTLRQLKQQAKGGYVAARRLARGESPPAGGYAVYGRFRLP